MKKNISIVLLILYVLYNPAVCFSWPWTTEETQEQKIESLRNKLEKHPEDSIIAYNLGVAQYHASKFSDAQASFEKALKHVGVNKKLEQQCLFNASSSALQHTHGMLPEAWENKEIDPSILDNAIQTVKKSLDWLKTFRANNTEDKKAKAAEEYAQKLLKKLEEKKKQQEQKKNEQQDKQDQEQKKDKEEKNNEQKQQNQGNQDKQHESKNDQQQQDNKQEQQQNQQKNQGQHDKQESNDQEKDQGQESQQSGDDVDQKKNEGHQDQDNRDSENNSEKNNEKPAEASDAKSDNHEPHPQPSEQETNQQDTQMQGSEQIGQQSSEPQQESAEMKGIRAVLENLQADESKVQKRIMLRQTKDHKQPQGSYQKPW